MESTEEPINILIVEDEGTIAVRLAKYLRQWGYFENVAATGEEALVIAEETQPLLALMDIRLDGGGMDGIAAAAELRKRFDIPVIFLTAYIDDELLERARQTEPYGYIVKPLQESTLQATLEMALAKLKTDIQLKILLREKDALIKEKELLMREILHRTKNNMTSLCSIINLQSAAITDPAMQNILKDMETRVRTLALIQEKLHNAQDFQHLDLREYLYDLTTTIFANFQSGFSKIKLSYDLQPVISSTNTAIYCGMIINELLTNSVKYAFPEHKTGEIAIILRIDPDGRIVFGLKDNGVGLEPEFNLEKTNTLGMKIVKLLAVHQLKGEIRLEQTQGTGWLVRFRE